MKVKKGDTVLVIAGKDKGTRGKVLAALPREDKVIVEGVNRVKKHTRHPHHPAWFEDRWHRDPGSRHPRLERDGDRLGQQADPRRLPASTRTASRPARRVAPVRICDDDGRQRR